MATVGFTGGMADRSWGFRTRALHAGGQPDPTTGARAVPIYQTTSYVFESADDAANLFALQKYGNVYTRIGNPTVAAFEERIASLEGGLGAVATSSGQSAEFLTFAALAGAGDEIVAAASLYGGTITQLDVTLRRFGVTTTFVRGTDPADYAAAITDRTKLLFPRWWPTRAARSATSGGWPTSRTPRASRWWSTRRPRPRGCVGRLSTVRTS